VDDELAAFEKFALEGGPRLAPLSAGPPNPVLEPVQGRSECRLRTQAPITSSEPGSPPLIRSAQRIQTIAGTSTRFASHRSQPSKARRWSSAPFLTRASCGPATIAFPMTTARPHVGLRCKTGRWTPTHSRAPHKVRASRPISPTERCSRHERSPAKPSLQPFPDAHCDDRHDPAVVPAEAV